LEVEGSPVAPRLDVTGNGATEGVIGRSVHCSKHAKTTRIEKVGSGLRFLACGCHEVAE
jgi:hypothetical protein